MIPTADGPAPSSQGAREQRLVSVLSRARGRGQFLPTERWLFTAGSALVVGGLVLIVIGWVGTSQTILVAGQIPYVVSGGLLGLGLVFLGGFLYFGYWLSLLVRDTRLRGEQDREDLARVSEELREINRSLAIMAGLLDTERSSTDRGRAPRTPAPSPPASTRGRRQ